MLICANGTGSPVIWLITVQLLCCASSRMTVIKQRNNNPVNVLNLTEKLISRSFYLFLAEPNHTCCSSLKMRKIDLIYLP